jgi:hypothetical protein
MKKSLLLMFLSFSIQGLSARYDNYSAISLKPYLKPILQALAIGALWTFGDDVKSSRKDFLSDNQKAFFNLASKFGSIGLLLEYNTPEKCNMWLHWSILIGFIATGSVLSHMITQKILK